MFIDPIFSLGSQCLIATQVANSFGLVCIVTNAVPGWVDKTIKTPSFQRVDMTDIGIDMNRYDKDIAIQCNSIQFIPYLIESMYGIFTYIGIILNYFRGQCR
jgi:hypothetical protein